MAGENWNDLDRQIALALQVDGRASWVAIARALGVPERTIARRGQRLLDTGAVRVSTYLDTTRVGHARPVVVHVRTLPGRAMTTARWLSERADASSVSVLEGSGDIASMLLPRSQAATSRLLLVELPSIDGVVSVEASTVLRYFRSGYDWYAGELPESVVSQLRLEMRGTGDDTGDEPIVLSESDEALVGLLARDGRTTVVRLAHELNTTTQTMRRRLDALFQAGALHVRTEVTPRLHGLRVEAMSWLRVPADQIEAAGTDLAKNPAVRFCVAMTGPSQILLDCLVRDEQALYAFLTQVVGGHPSATITRTSVILHAIRRGPMIVDGPLAEAE